MVFGEITEPSTRALIEDEFEQNIQNARSLINWEGPKAPTVINTFIVVESYAFRELFKRHILDEAKLYGEFKNIGIKIYNLQNDNYVLISNLCNDVTHGEVVESLADWIINALNIYCITASAIPLYINTDVASKAECFIRCLTHKQSNSFQYPILESPNLVSGLGAAVLTYCIHIGIPCALFIAYIDSAPLDSITLKPLLKFVNKLNVTKIKSCKIVMNAPTNNLYM